MIKKINQAASILGLLFCAVLAYGFWKAGLFNSKADKQHNGKFL